MSHGRAKDEKAGLLLLALDGNDTVGGTKYLVQADGLSWMLDFGTNYHKLSRYYEEYLIPRANQGILDLVTMGIIPDARGLYRDDVMLPDLDLRGPEVGSIDAVLITHAHLDHAGAVGLLRPEIPTVTNALTAATLKAIQDCGGSDWGLLYSASHEVTESRGSPLLVTGGPKVQRDLVVADGGWSKGFEEFWRASRWKTKDLEGGELRKNLGDLRCRAFPIDHSVKGALGFLLDTPQGRLVYPGDVRMHGLNARYTRDFLEAARSPRPYVLFMEGTNIDKSDTEIATEEDVRRNVNALLSGMAGDFAIADFGARNIERLEIFAAAAAEHGRRLVVTPKDAYLLHAMHTVDPAVPVPGDRLCVFDSPTSGKGIVEEFVFENFGDAAVKASTIRQSPGDYLVAFSFFDMKHLVALRPDGGHYIYSSSEAFSEEQEIDFRRLREWLNKFGIQWYGLEFDSEGHVHVPSGSAGLHASGHAPARDLEKIIRTINPEVIVPLHTGSPEAFEQRFGGDFEVVLPPLCDWTEL
jgi:ribonuclease J